MSKVKTKVEFAKVDSFLENLFNSKVDNLMTLGGGEFSQAFSFVFEKNKYVIKIRKTRKSFEKEKIAHEILTMKKTSIPIPKIHDIGLFQENQQKKLYYCISDRVPGKILTEYRFSELKQIDPFLIRMLINIHKVDISDSINYGQWKRYDKTYFQSWREYILDFVKNQKKYWNKMFSTGLFDKDLYKKITKEIENLIVYCSEKRYLIHGDYGFDNVLATPKGEITGIIDWELSMFGDFVYDIAWLDFWSFIQDGIHSKLYRRIYGKLYNEEINNYTERLNCYKLYIGLASLAFFSESLQQAKYTEVKERVEKLI